MFERFTDRARRVVVLAQEEARLIPHHRAGTGHLLLGLIREGEAVAALTLADLGVTLEAARERVVAIEPAMAVQAPGHLGFTPRLKKVLEFSLREALRLGHNDVGTEHLLLAVEREGGGVAARVLREFAPEPGAVRQAVLARLHGYEAAERGQQPVAALSCHREPSASDVLAACRTVAGRLSDLDGHIEARASEIAAEAITGAEIECDKEVEQAKAEVVREQDLVIELRRHVAVLERRAERAESALAAAREELSRLERDRWKETRSDA